MSEQKKAETRITRPVFREGGGIVNCRTKSKINSLPKEYSEIHHTCKCGPYGGSLSCVDILNVLYNVVLNVSPQNFSSPDRDRYIQSKGHCVEALFVVLANKGFFPEEDLNTLCKYQSHYIGHPTKKVKGIEQNTGSLGHGLPISVGTALAAKMDKKDYKFIRF
jgi:transketolase